MAAYPEFSGFYKPPDDFPFKVGDVVRVREKFWIDESANHPGCSEDMYLMAGGIYLIWKIIPKGPNWIILDEIHPIEPRIHRDEFGNGGVGWKWKYNWLEKHSLYNFHLEELRWW